jgi:hypothetical protein
MFLGVIIAVLLLAAVMIWINLNILVPSGGDEIFAPLWEATRYAVEGYGSPYAPGAVARTSILLDDSRLPPHFVYPYYTIPIFAPFALIGSYSLARAVWMTVMLACLVGLTFTALAFTRWRPRGFTVLFYLVFSFGSVPAVRAFYLGNPALLAALLVALGLLMVIQKRYGSAGVLFGLSIIKPQMVVFLLVFVLLWAVSRRHLQLVWSMSFTVIVLVAGSILAAPTWLIANYYQMLEFFRETFPASFAAAVWVWLPTSGPWAMGMTAAALFLWLLVEWWRALSKDERWFLWTASLTLTISHLIGLPSSISNQVILIIPLALVFSLWSQRFQPAGNTLSVVVMITIAGGGWLAYWLTMGANFSNQASTLMLSLRPFVSLLLLYWMRYWALNSVRLKVSHLEALRRL